MKGMFRFKAHNGDKVVSLYIHFNNLEGRILVDGKRVCCQGDNLKIMESLTDKDYERVFTIDRREKGIIAVELKKGLFSVESERNVFHEFSKTHIAHFEGVN
jgi:hypothetical protein